jgi:hypothetical protein
VIKVREVAKAEITGVAERSDSQQLSSPNKDKIRKLKSRREPQEVNVNKLDKLLERLKEIGLTHEKLKAKVKLSRSTINKYRNHKTCDDSTHKKIEEFIEKFKGFEDMTNEKLEEILGKFEQDPESSKISEGEQNSSVGIVIEGDKLSHFLKQGLDEVIPADQLKASQYSHENCLRNKIKTSLWVAGVLAKKWTDLTHREMFEECLNFRLGSSEVRFLLIHPESEIYKRLHERYPDINNSYSLNQLKKLMERFKNLKVKLLMDLSQYRSQYRLVFINGTTLVFSKYEFSIESTSSDYLVIKSDPNLPAPIYSIFHDFYENLWSSGVNLEDVTLPNDFESNG